MKPTLTPRIKATLLRAIDTEQFEFGRHSDLDEAKEFIRALAAYWPTLDGVPEGIDRFSQWPVSGETIAPQQES